MIQFTMGIRKHSPHFIKAKTDLFFIQQLFPPALNKILAFIHFPLILSLYKPRNLIIVHFQMIISLYHSHFLAGYAITVLIISWPDIGKTRDASLA